MWVWNCELAGVIAEWLKKEHIAVLGMHTCINKKMLEDLVVCIGKLKRVWMYFEAGNWKQELCGNHLQEKKKCFVNVGDLRIL